MFCSKCGSEISDNSRFCRVCGSKTGESSSTKKSAKSSNVVEKVADKINEMSGGKGHAELRFSDLFSQVLKKHTTAEADDIFICGTTKTTPKIADIVSEWPRPWLFSRVALWMLLAFAILRIAWHFYQNPNLLPGLIFIGAFVVPLSVLFFFFETNIPRNISFMKALQVFLVGGCASLLCTLLLIEIFPPGELDIIGAMIVGIVEEAGKIIIVAWFISRMSDCIFVFNGILIGGAVGAGFAAFESAGYAMRSLVQTIPAYVIDNMFRIFNEYANDVNWDQMIATAQREGLSDGLIRGYDEMISTITTRALLAPAGHVAWAAVEGAAIMICLDHSEFTWKVLLDKRFLIFSGICVLLHGFWDSPLLEGYFYLKVLIRFVAIWIVLIVMINRGLDDVNNSIEKAKNR